MKLCSRKVIATFIDYLLYVNVHFCKQNIETSVETYEVMYFIGNKLIEKYL